MITIEIPIRVASKKNNRRNFRNVSLPSLAYIKFHTFVAEYLLPFSHLHFTRPLRIDIEYHTKGKLPQDLDNAISSVFDCLTDYHIIEDDKLIIEIRAKKIAGAKDWLCIIKLEEIDK